MLCKMREGMLLENIQDIIENNDGVTMIAKIPPPCCVSNALITNTLRNTPFGTVDTAPCVVVPNL